MSSFGPLFTELFGSVALGVWGAVERLWEASHNRSVVPKTPIFTDEYAQYPLFTQALCAS